MVELKGLHKDGHLGLVDQLQELGLLGRNEADLVRVVQLGQVEVGQVETWMREGSYNPPCLDTLRLEWYKW